MQAATIADILPPERENAVNRPELITINKEDLVIPTPVGVVKPMKPKRKRKAAANQSGNQAAQPGGATPQPSTSGYRATNRGTARTWADNPIPRPSSTNVAIGQTFPIDDIEGVGFQIQDVRTDLEAWNTSQATTDQYLVFYAEVDPSNQEATSASQ